MAAINGIWSVRFGSCVLDSFVRTACFEILILTGFFVLPFATYSRWARKRAPCCACLYSFCFWPNVLLLPFSLPFGVALSSERGLISRIASCLMSVLLKHQVERLEHAIELSTDWLEIHYLMAEIEQLKHLYDEPNAEAAWWLLIFVKFFLFVAKTIKGLTLLHHWSYFVWFNPINA